MANPKGNEASLTKFEQKWQSGKTQTIRVPIALAGDLLEIAKKIDEGEINPQDFKDLIRDKKKSQITKLLNEVLKLVGDHHVEIELKIEKAIAILETITE